MTHASQFSFRRAPVFRRGARPRALFICSLLFAVTTTHLRGAETPAEKFFHEQVAPILTAHCLECHNANARQGGLSLETLAEAVRGGDEGPAVAARNVAESLLLQKIVPSAPGGTPEMPKDRPPLGVDDVARLRRWIADGAAWPRAIVLKPRAKADKSWWSLQPLANVEPPAIDDVAADLPAAWRTDPIDRFIYAELAEKGLRPNPPADPRDLVRRVTYDLTGLPPTPEEVEAFVRACSSTPALPRSSTPPATEPRDEEHGRARDFDKAYAALVDRLLASPRYGEHWGRHWLDVVRFGESNGYERNVPIDNVWPFRDYVIRSFNDDKPFDRFLREHLAGDVLGPNDPNSELGTVFLVCGPYDNVGNQDPVAKKRIRSDALDDIITAVGGAMLGLTLNCARCHDHKFDPILQTDYYRLSAAFDGVSHGERKIETVAERRRRLEYEERVVKPLRRREQTISRRLNELEESTAAAHAEELNRKPDGYPQPAVVAGMNEDVFPPIDARFVRFTVLNKRGDVGGAKATVVEEIEVWTAGPDARNVALHAHGGRARVATQRPSENPPEAYGAPLLNDGRFGPKWTAGDEAAAILEWPEVRRIARVVFSAERGSEVEAKRRQATLPADYRIEASIDGAQWRTLVESDRRRPPLTPQHARARLMRLFAPADVRREYDALRRELAETVEMLRPVDERVRELTTERSAMLARLETWRPDDPAAIDERSRLESLEEKLADARRRAAEVPTVPSVFAGVFKQPSEPTRVFRGGDVSKPGDAVLPAAPEVLSAVTPGYALTAAAPEAERRRRLAEWLTSDADPLVPRVLVNRLWHYRFGTGIVDTPSDFGYMGGRPTHPELLDYLALRLKQHGWRLKALHREMLLSQTYRQSATFRAEAAAVDADARRLWRFPPRRLTAEELRDSMLAAAGKLDLKMGGPGFRLFHAAQDNVVTYIPLDRHPPETYRRAVYHQHVRAGRFDLLTDFDLPDSALPAPRRGSTTTPLQAFTLLNHSFTLDMAAALARRIETEAPSSDDAAQIDRAYRLLFGRAPDEQETASAREFIVAHGREPWCRALFNAAEFLYVQ